MMSVCTYVMTGEWLQIFMTFITDVMPLEADHSRVLNFLQMLRLM